MPRAKRRSRIRAMETLRSPSPRTRSPPGLQGLCAVATVMITKLLALAGSRLALAKNAASRYVHSSSTRNIRHFYSRTQLHAFPALHHLIGFFTWTCSRLYILLYPFYELRSLHLASRSTLELYHHFVQLSAALLSNVSRRISLCAVSFSSLTAGNASTCERLGWSCTQ